MHVALCISLSLHTLRQLASSAKCLCLEVPMLRITPANTWAIGSGLSIQVHNTLDTTSQYSNSDYLDKLRKVYSYYGDYKMIKCDNYSGCLGPYWIDPLSQNDVYSGHFDHLDLWWLSWERLFRWEKTNWASFRVPSSTKMYG